MKTWAFKMKTYRLNPEKGGERSEEVTGQNTAASATGAQTEDSVSGLTADQTGRVQTTRPQNEPVQTSTAQTGGTVNAPLLHGSVFHGTVNINFGADSTHRGGDRSEKETGKTAAASSIAAQTGVSVSALTAAAKEDGSVKDALKRHFVAKFAKLYDRTSLEESNLLLKDIYTELYVIEGCTGGVNTEHEVRQIECFYPKIEETPIKFSDTFKTQSNQNVLGTKVLTLGIAGVGKTASVHKFILEWAEDKCNQDLDFILFFPFRELNVIKEEQYSFCKLLCYFHDEFHNADVREILNDKCKVVFILDGLDESKLNLDFNQKKLSDVTKTATVDKLITNLIKGELLSSALIWITTRPAAAKQIPHNYFDHVTEIRGFHDPQKEEYLRKRIRDEDQASRIISHVKTARSLHILCHIPVFCSITATVLQEILTNDKDMKNAPTTLTEMYTRFLLFHTRKKSEKYSTMQNEDCTVAPSKRGRLGVEGVLKLGKLAFLQLQKGQLIFYENDLKECGIDVDEAVVYSGVCTQIFKKDENIFSFVHLSFQEFLAAVFVFLTFSHKCNPLLQNIGEKIKWKFKHTLGDLLKTAVQKAMKSENGHLDLFLRFLCGLSLESNQRLLKSLQPEIDIKEESLKNTADYIKRKIEKTKYSEKSINLFHCLSELKDSSLTSKVQEYLNSGDLSTQKLSSTQWSALVFVLLMSEETQEMFELRKYRPSEEGLRKLLPVVKSTRRALLDHCNLSEDICEAVASVLSSDSPLKELDLSNNDLQDSGVELLSAGLTNSRCKLEILRLFRVRLVQKVSSKRHPIKADKEQHQTAQDGQLLSSVKKHTARPAKIHGAAWAEPRPHYGYSDHISVMLIPTYRPLIRRAKPDQKQAFKSRDKASLRIARVKLSHAIKEAKRAYSKKIHNHFQNTADTWHMWQGIQAITNYKSPPPACDSDGSLPDALNNFYARFEARNGTTARKTTPPPSEQVLCLSTADVRRSLHRVNPRKAPGSDSIPGRVLKECAKQLADILTDIFNISLSTAVVPTCFKSSTIIPCFESLVMRRIKDQLPPSLDPLQFAYRPNRSIDDAISSTLHLALTHLDNKDTYDSGVELLSAGLKSSHCKLETLRLAICKLSQQSCEILRSVLESQTSSLKELDLSDNDLQDLGVELLSAGLKSSHCKLQILRLSFCMVTGKGCSYLASALYSNSSCLKELDLTYNHPGVAGKKLLSARLEDPHCSLNILRLEYGGEIRITPGLKKYSCQFTLDPNTAYADLTLSDGNRNVTHVERHHAYHSYPDHPERFDGCWQVLCRESVTGRCYWEAERSGMVHIAVTYKSISRKGGSDDCGFGRNEKSWSLSCSNNSYSVCHNNNITAVSAPSYSCKRVGVYVDCPAGTLSFYSISSDTHTLTHLHTFYTTFTEPLYAGFTVCSDASLYLR
ncbi:uncharacterized protein LOC118803541 [Colossoma macropomum]|uniref:uncharacterized protein LOC118803541 n=1 Tax=Colossoma macropomum TaxID=42526 RepID=UPI0018652FC1|nr:uncharacterized protein LOC118803541 [Colossoma macropomum]